MAVTRFVNGLCDAEQKGLNARSVAMIAADLDIPDFVVDVRHAATHTELPSLPSLRVAVAAALDWLRTNYWDRQIAALEEARAEAHTQLLRYRENAASAAVEARAAADTSSRRMSAKARRAALAAAAALSTSSGSAEADDAVKQIVSCVPVGAVREVVVPALLEPGLLLPDAAAPLASAVASGGAAATAATTAATPTATPALLAPPDVKSRIALWSPALREFYAAWPHFAPSLIAALVDKAVEARRAAPPMAAVVSPAVNATAKAASAAAAAPTTGGSAFAVRAAAAASAVVAVSESPGAADAAEVGAWCAEWCTRILSDCGSVGAGQLRDITRRVLAYPMACMQPVLRALLDRLSSRSLGLAGSRSVDAGAAARVLTTFDIACGFPVPPSEADASLAPPVGAMALFGAAGETSGRPGGSTSDASATAFAARVAAVTSAASAVQSPSARSEGSSSAGAGAGAAWRCEVNPRWIDLAIGFVASGSVGNLEVPPRAPLARRHGDARGEAADFSDGNGDDDVGRGAKRAADDANTDGEQARASADGGVGDDGVGSWGKRRRLGPLGGDDGRFFADVAAKVVLL
jgi:hypothetical protein